MASLRFALLAKKGDGSRRALWRSPNPKSVVASRLAESAEFGILALSENQIQKLLGSVVGGGESGAAAQAPWAIFSVLFGKE